MKGVIVFLLVFALGVVVTISNTALPPGRQLYSLLNVPDTSYPVLGIPATTLAISILNGVVYGFVVWLIFTIVWSITGMGKKEKVTVNVNVDAGKGESKSETK